jgi:putative membrane protein
MKTLRSRICCALTVLAVAGWTAQAHDGAAVESNSGGLLKSWSLHPWMLIPLGLSGWLYTRGVSRLWRTAGRGHGVRRWQAACFATGWFALVAALISPLHEWSETLFSAHMIQHELLMLVAAPGLVLGKPIVAILKALPRSQVRALLRLAAIGSVRAAWRFITSPLVAWVIHLVALWMWHVPVLFRAALHDEAIHAVQHLGFLLSALLFWWAILDRSRGAMDSGAAVLFLFTTALHSGLLGAMITLSDDVLYADDTTAAEAWGLTAIEDQQLGGLIMWVPACTIYIAGGLALFAVWLRSSSERMRRSKGLMNQAAIILLAALVAGCNGCSDHKERAARITGGDPDRGRDAITRLGCASCHSIPGIPGDANVGPPLDRIAGRVYIAGVQLNTPANLARWLKNPREVDPRTAMPDIGATDDEVRDISAYLHTLR